MARVTRHRRVAQRRNASPGCSARPRLFIEFHLTRGRIWRLLDRNAPIVDYEKSFRFCQYRVEQHYFFGVPEGFPRRRPDLFFRPSSSCIGTINQQIERLPRCCVAPVDVLEYHQEGSLAESPSTCEISAASVLSLRFCGLRSIGG
jgi:hypothetical protein